MYEAAVFCYTMTPSFVSPLSSKYVSIGILPSSKGFQMYVTPLMRIPHNRMAFCQKALTRANWRVSPRIRCMHVVAFCQQVYKQWHFAN